jgi:hypothetical protein
VKIFLFGEDPIVSMGLTSGGSLFEYGIALLILSVFGPSLASSFSLTGGITGSQTFDTLKTIGIVLIAIAAYKEFQGPSM